MERPETHPPLWVGAAGLAYLGILGFASSAGRPVLGLLLLVPMALGLLFWARMPRIGGTLILVLQVGIGLQLVPAFIFESRVFQVLSLGMLLATPALVLPAIFGRSLSVWQESAAYALFIVGGLLTHMQGLWIRSPLLLPLQIADIFLVMVVASSISVFLLLRSGRLRVRHLLSGVVLGAGALCIAIVLHAVLLQQDYLLSQARLGVYLPIGPNLLAFALDICLPVSIGLALSESRPGWKRVFVAISFVMFFALAYTGTRGSLATQVIVVSWMGYRFRKARWFWPVAALSVVLLGAIVIPRAAARLVSTSPGEIMSHLGRLWMLEASYGILRAKGYLLGAGFDSFRIIKYDFGFPFWFNPAKTMSSHNTYLEYWIGWGLPCLFGYLWLIGLAMRRAFAAAERGSDLGMGLFVGLLGYSIHGFVDCSLVLFPVTMTFWIVLACALSLESPREGDSRRGEVVP